MGAAGCAARPRSAPAHRQMRRGSSQSLTGTAPYHAAPSPPCPLTPRHRAPPPPHPLRPPRPSAHPPHSLTTSRRCPCHARTHARLRKWDCASGTAQVILRKWDCASKVSGTAQASRTAQASLLAQSRLREPGRCLVTGLPHAAHLPPRRPPRAAPHRPRHQRRARRPRLRRAHARALQRWRRCSAGDGPRRVPRGRIQCRGQAERHAALRADGGAVGAGRRRRRWQRPALGRRRRHHHTRVGSDRAEPDPRTGNASTRPSPSAFAVGLRRRPSPSPSASAERRSNAACAAARRAAVAVARGRVDRRGGRRARVPDLPVSRRPGPRDAESPLPSLAACAAAALRLRCSSARPGPT
jgi:hypothetical protein